MSESFKQTALFPGSFDPFTVGHLDVLRRAAPLFQSVIIGVGYRSGKVGMLEPQVRVELIEKVLRQERCFDHVQVMTFQGLLADFAKRHQAKWVVRGVRGEADVSYELQMAHMNRQLYNGVSRDDTRGSATLDTFLIPCAQNLSHISSTLVREVAHAGGALDPFVPPVVSAYLSNSKFEAIR